MQLEYCYPPGRETKGLRELRSLCPWSQVAHQQEERCVWVCVGGGGAGQQSKIRIKANSPEQGSVFHMAAVL